MDPIPHSKPWITDADRRAVEQTLRSCMLAQGERARELERKLSAWVNAVDGVAVGSGSAALVLALRGVGVKPGDEVILPSYVCPSVMEAVLTAEADPVLCDVGADWVVTPEDVVRRVTQRTQAVIIPHMYGVFADVGSFRSLGLAVIEDCAQAVDANGRRGMTADVAVFSLHPTKCLTAGEGGVAVSEDPDIVAAMRRLRDGSPDVDSPRLFSPLSDIAASLALSQLARYSQALTRRQEIAHRYLRALEPIIPGSLNLSAFQSSMHFRFPIRVKGGLGSHRATFLQAGIHVRQGVDVLLHRRLGLLDADFRMSVAHFASTISLPIYPALSAEQESYCVEQAAEILSKPAVRDIATSSSPSPGEHQ
jgi:perosamine synthetase